MPQIHNCYLFPKLPVGHLARLTTRCSEDDNVSYGKHTEVGQLRHCKPPQMDRASTNKVLTCGRRCRGASSYSNKAEPSRKPASRLRAEAGPSEGELSEAGPSTGPSPSPQRRLEMMFDAARTQEEEDQQLAVAVHRSLQMQDSD